MSHQFEYDETGAFFSYFLISICSFVLIVLTYLVKNYFFANKPTLENTIRCTCSECNLKETTLSQKSTKKYSKIFAFFIVLIAWGFMMIISYKLSRRKSDIKIAFDPYEILGVPMGAKLIEIKAAYRKQVVKKHPDHGGDMEEYITLTKAYKTLTDDVARNNYEKYGNPDGLQSTSFGIALPSWLVDKRYSKGVIFVYFLLFILGVPLVIVVWWYRSRQYYSDKLLVSTLQLYSYFLRKSSEINWKTIIDIICSSTELTPKYLRCMKISSNQSEEIQKLAQKFKIKPKNDLFNAPACIKAKCLLFSHINRVNLSKNLRANFDDFILKFFTLLTEIQNLAFVFHYYKVIGHIQHGPSLDTVLTALRLSSVLIQGIQISDSSLLQLPYFTDDFIEKIRRKKKFVNSIVSLIDLQEKDRDSILKDFSSSEKFDILAVLNNMPCLSIHPQTLVGDEIDPPNIEAFSTATIRFQITRNSMLTKNPNNFPENNGKDVHFIVHCPLFPHLKKEGWWILIVNSNDKIVSGPLYFQLQSSIQCVDLPLTFIDNLGKFKLKYLIISDSYKDNEYQGDLNFNIIKPKVGEEISHPQWDNLSDESEADEEVLTDTEINNIST